MSFFIIELLKHFKPQNLLLDFDVNKLLPNFVALITNTALMKRTILFLIINCQLSIINCDAQTFWVERAGGSTIDEGISISTDVNGNSYSTGYFTTTATFGTTTLSSAGSTDIYITKLNHAGQYIWAVRAGGGGTDKPTAIKADAQGNSYITGFFYGTAHFGTHSVTSEGLQDVFIAKYDSAGTCLWAASCGGAASDIGNAITVDNSGNVIVTGQFKDSANFGPYHLISMDSSIDVFTVKLDANGNFLWVKQGAAPYVDRGLGVAADGTGNIYVTGQFSDTITFEFVHDNPMYNAIFLIKYDANGNELWFRRAGGGGEDLPTGIVLDNAGNPIITGDFQGNLIFFAAPTNFTLNDPYFNRIFVAKYDANGNLLWNAASSSDGALTSHGIAIDATNNLYVIGDFGCRLNKYADVYGQGIFNSVGYSDIFVSKWNAAGAWQWARQIGGVDNDYGNGIVIDTSQNAVITGSFNSPDLFFPMRQNHFLGYNTGVNNFGCSHIPYCGDSSYNNYVEIGTSGNSDIFIARAVDPARQPLDLYRRTDSSCNRDFKGVVIDENYITGQRIDSVSFCVEGTLSAYANICVYYYNSLLFNWSTLSNSEVIYNVNSPGYYSVTMTTADGCFTSHDSIYVTIHPDPPIPTITDNHNININATNTTAIVLCKPDSIVILNAGNLDSVKYQWQGGPLNDSTITVTHAENIRITVTDSFGCINFNQVQIVVDSLLTPIIPGMICPNDTSHKDTISLCANGYFEMILFDSISDPLRQIIYDPIQLAYDPYAGNSESIQWSTNPVLSYNPFTQVNDDVFYPALTNWYTITAIITRQTSCGPVSIDTVTRRIYIIVNPVPTLIPYYPNITGNTVLCPGDSILLIGSGLPSYHWNTGKTTDSIYATHTGVYEISYYEMDTNIYGCRSQESFIATITITTMPQPLITMTPSDGLICPNDSVQLICNGTGTYNWQGPNGPFGGNDDTVYATTAGDYYCLFSDVGGCQLVTNDVEVDQYGTPYVEVLPDVMFCPGDSVQLSVVASQGSTINWLSPLSGNSLTQWVHLSGSYTCVVTSCNIVTSATATVVLSNPVAQITANATSLCTGDTLVLNGTLGMATYFWLPDSTGFTTDSIHHAGVYKLLITDPYGCTATDSITISSPNDTVRSLFSASPLTGCNPLTVSFTNTSYHAESYHWSFGDNDTSNLQNPTHTYDSSGTFTVKLISFHTNSCGTFTDTLVETNYITIYPLVTASFTADTLNGCAPFTVDFINTSHNATNYHWSFGDTATSSAVNPSHTYDTTGNYTITLIATDSHGCSDTVSVPDYITVLYPITPVSSFTANPLSGCDSVTVHFSNTSSFGTNYLWRFGDGSTDTSANPIHQYDSTGTFSITLITYSINICGTLIDSIIQTNYITIYPSAHASFSANDSLGCVPFTVIFNNTSTNATGYNWAFGDGNFSTSQTPSNTYTTANAYTVTLIADGIGGCNDTAHLSFISVINPPVVTSSFIADTFRGCAPLTVNFMNTGIGGTNYLWTFGDNDSSTSKNPVHIFTDSGVYTIKLLTINDTSICGIFKDSTTINDYIEVGDSAKITSNFSILPLKGCTPLIVNITNSSSNSSNAYWDFGNGQFSIDSSLKSFIYYKAGSYQITLINSNPNNRCYNKPDTMSVEVVADSCMISIPNTFTPNNDGYNDYFNLVADGCTNYHLIIFNRWGEKIFESFQNNLLWDGYDASGMQCPDGTYFYIFTATDYNEQPFSEKGFVTLIR